MSKINALRIINLNYNNNTIKIDDETFDFASESTLMSLRNGGGKTVLVQMMMSPFVSKRNRDLKDRKFKSYFQTNPTYILTEWKLDGSGGYLLVGMVVRKKPVVADDNSTDELDIYSFVHQYDRKSQYDIYSIPIIETRKDGKRSIKSYQKFKTEVEDARKTLKGPLDVYNMNVYEQSKKYFQKLKEYKIDNKEWNIIHRINLKESGLSELFSDSKNVEGLVEKWFLTTVEDKLNKSGDKIKNFNEIVKKYIFQYKEIQSKIEKKDTIELFCGELEGLIENATVLSNNESLLEKQKNIIANFIDYLGKLKVETENEMNFLQNKIEELQNIVTDLKYQQISKEWYEKDIEREKLNSLLEELYEKKQLLEQNKKKIENELNIYECSEFHEDYKKKLENLRELESKLEYINKTEKEKAPERNNLGYSLKIYYEKESKSLNDKISKVNTNISNINITLDKIKEKENKLREDYTLKIKTQSKLEQSIKNFEKEEERFEEKSNIKIKKNILGEYEDDFLDNVEKNIQSDIQEYNNRKKQIEKESEDLNILVESKGKEQQSLAGVDKEIKLNLDNFIKDKLKYEEQIKFRENVVRILGISEENIYNKQLILDKLEEKIKYVNNKSNQLIIEKSRLENEKMKLERGILTEIPAKLKVELEQLDIDFIYGMEWLNKNNKTLKENQALIKNNPFLPYSLILSEEDLFKIQKSKLNENISSPIPIIKRTSIFNEMNSENNLLKLDDISFYISFDQRLVNKKELTKIIEEKSGDINKITDKISLNEIEKKDYLEKFHKINETSVELKFYNALLAKIDSTKAEISELEDKIIKNDALIKQSNIKIRENTKTYNSYVEVLAKLENNMTDFIELKNNYKEYLNNQKKLSETNKEISLTNSSILKCNYDLEENKLLLKMEDEHLNSIKAELKEVQKEAVEYSQYNEGVIIERDFEVIKSEYNALTSEISKDKAFVEKMKNKANEEFKESQDKLLEKQKEYSIEEKDFKEIKYDKFKHKEIKDELKRTNELFSKQKDEINDKKLEYTRLEESLKNIEQNILEKFGLNYPKSKEQIMNVDFKLEIKLKNQQKTEFENKYNIKKSDFGIIDINIYKLDQYKDYSIFENINVEVNIKQLEEYKNSIISELNNCQHKVEQSKLYMQRLIENTYNNVKFKSEPMVSTSLETIRECLDKTNSLLEQLTIVLQSCENLMEKLKVDIEFIYKDEEEVLTILFEYIRDVHDNLGMIDDNSSVNIEGKSIKMLKIKLPDWDLNKEIYKSSLKFILDKLRDSSLDKLSQNEAIDEIISKTIATNYLYNNTVGISNIEIKLYKIEENRQSEISWNNVSTNSGGEGFLSAFVILSSLLTYMRKDETDIFSNSKDSKVIVMDNPFAQTNASHLLIPLMNIAQKSNTQLICFSGLGGDSIYNRFNNIYVLETKQSKLSSNQQYLKHSHEKGKEFVDKIHSSRFKIEEKPVEQMTLF